MADVIPEPSPSLHAFDAHIHELQERISATIERTDGTPLHLTDWTRPEGGGGRMGMSRGTVIEKGACHISHVHGHQSPLTGAPFRAAGLSLILHPRNPHVPTVHLNMRRFEEPERAWWGGGIDLTPLGIWHDDDVVHFHDTLVATLGVRYAAGRSAANDYFRVHHRDRDRGAGGVFYDHVDQGDPEADRLFIQSIGERFFDAYLPILERRRDKPYHDDDRRRQCIDRGIYVEFNLLYDRGTRFGLESGGNVDAILSSLPPEVHWP